MPWRPVSSDPIELQRSELQKTCIRFLGGHGRQEAHEELALLASYAEKNAASADRYGSGVFLQGFEREIADLLGKQEALFMPSGTMAQQIALRIWSERANVPHVGFHPTCHMELNEYQGYSWLHGLRASLLGERTRLLSARDIEDCPERMACVLVELPHRHLGGELPQWEALEAIQGAAKAKGARLHMDGARLWESQPFYGKPLNRICAGFDSVYVSFYKGLGGLSGAMLAGPSDFIAEARIWLRRHGGNLFQIHPYALSAKAGFESKRDRFPAYRDAIRQVAELFALSAPEAGLRIRPELPHTNMMHVFIPRTPAQLNSARDEVARKERLWLGGGFRECEVPGWSMMEISAGEATLELLRPESKDLLRRSIGKLLGAS